MTFTSPHTLAASSTVSIPVPTATGRAPQYLTMNVCEGLQVITGILLEGLVSCVPLSSCVKKKRKTFNPVTPKSAPQHKSTKIPHVIQQKFRKTRYGCLQKYLWSGSLHNRTLGFNSQVQNFKINWAGNIPFFALLGCVASFSDINNIVIACTTTLINLIIKLNKLLSLLFRMSRKLSTLFLFSPKVEWPEKYLLYIDFSHFPTIIIFKRKEKHFSA